MLIAYFTTDEVNQWTAERLAAEHELTLCPMFLSGGPSEEGFDALLFDWDFLPAIWRDEDWTMLTTRPLACPAAVHSYHLSDKQIEALRANGVQVRRRLEPRLFAELVQAVIRGRPTLRPYWTAPAATTEEPDAPVGSREIPSIVTR